MQERGWVVGEKYLSRPVGTYHGPLVPTTARWYLLRPHPGTPRVGTYCGHAVVNKIKRSAIFLVKTSTAQVNKHFLMISIITYLTFRRGNDVLPWQVVRAIQPTELPR